MMKLNWWQKLVKTTILGVLLITFSIGLSGAFSDTSKMSAKKSVLAQGDYITDPESILRYALPIKDENIRQIQKDIEAIDRNIRRQRWAAIRKDVKNAAFVLSLNSADIIANMGIDNQSVSQDLVAQLTKDIEVLSVAVEEENKEQIRTVRDKILNEITAIEELMVSGFPFKVPDDYANLPKLLGRATVEMETTKGSLTMVIDGYSAPVTGGNFIDLVQRGFYDNLPFIRAEDYFVLQTGDPAGEEEGFIDPKTKEYRSIPFEILLKGESEPLYELTTEDVGMYLAQPVLPFNAYGALALARPSTNPNGGSSQFFFFKFDTEVTPPGYNLMDGRYAVFGYLTEGADVLDALTAEDKIISAKVVKGLDNLVQPNS